MKNIRIKEKFKTFAKMTDNFSKVLLKSFEIATERKATTLNSQDLFLAILVFKTCLAAKLLERLGVDLDATAIGIRSNFEMNSGHSDNSILSSDNLSPNSGQKNSSKNHAINQNQFAPEGYQIINSRQNLPLNNLPNNISKNVILGEEVKNILAQSYLIANELGHVYVGTEHLLLAIIKQDNYPFIKDLAKNNLTFEFLRQSLLSFGVYQPGVFAKANETEEQSDGKDAINYFTRDMNKLAEEGRYLKVWGRNDEVERIIHILSRRTKNNALLIGEAGVGKTAVVEGLVQRLIAGDVPESFRHKKIVQLDVSAIVAGSKIRGDVEERLLNIVSEMANNPDLIIFIDEIHMIVGAGTAGSSGTMDIANIIKPYLTTGDLRIIGSTTFNDYQKYIEEDDALARRFQTIFVNEISKEDGVKVLEMLKPQFEKFHNVKFTEEALIEAVFLSDRFIPAKYLPDKAIDVIDEAAAARKIATKKTIIDITEFKEKLTKIKKLKETALRNHNLDKATNLRKEEKDLLNEINKIKEKSNKTRKAIVDVEEIRSVIAKWSGVPVNNLKSDDLKKLSKLNGILNENIIGQRDSISKITSVLKRARMDLTESGKPLASFIFLGPTGVGKTQTAKEIAEHYYGSNDALIQVDMSEYMEQHSVSKLIGSPPGYVGFQEGGQLTEKIRRKPYSIVLFDEIEKAHPDLLGILLQILDEGSLVDGKGRKVNFKNCIIIMTSNIGAWESFDDKNLGFDLTQDNQEKVEKEYEKMKEIILSNLKDTLSPEFLNRIDEIIIFKKLSFESAEKIITLLLSEFNKRLEKRNIVLLFGKGVVKMLTKKGFSDEYGARNLKRTIQEDIENSLAEFLLEKKLVGRPAKKTEIKINLSKKKNNKEKLKFTL